MSSKLSIKDLALNGKKVLMRVDFNVPLDPSGVITDDSRIQAALPSIRYVLDHGGSLILMSHLGRPKGVPQPEFSLSPCAERLSELLQRPVTMAPDCVGSEVEAIVEELQPGQVVLLENLRFHPGEEKPEKDPTFAKQLAGLGDLYVDDAFGTAHRPHASVYVVPQLFPGKAAAGFLMEKEIEFLGNTFADPKRPFYSLIGGAKISSKIGVLQTLIKKVDGLFIGGGMAYTFLKALGIPIGNSIHEDEYIGIALKIIDECKAKKIPLWLPQDLIVADKVKEGARTQLIEVNKSGIPDGFEGVDIGPKTLQTYIQELKKAKTIFWNGPVGVFEVPAFSKGTYALAKAIAEMHAVKIVGGGDSVAALNAQGLATLMTHVSTGGGASLELIEFGTLPGIEALS